MKTKLFELKPCPQCKGTGDAHHQGHYYDCGDCLGTGYEEPQGRIINLELMLNEHKMALKSSDAHNNDLAQKFEMAQEQIDHILLRLGRTQEKMFDAEMQRDRLAEALQKLRNNESMSLGGAAYEIVEQALQSLTTNPPTSEKI